MKRGDGWETRGREGLTLWGLITDKCYLITSLSLCASFTASHPKWAVHAPALPPPVSSPLPCLPAHAFPPFTHSYNHLL